jgi:photosystem II stability/assembly factor-like uncharacterized protein
MKAYKKGSIIIMLLILLLCSKTNSQTWQKIEMNFPPGDTLLNYLSISFATKNIGWMISQGIKSALPLHSSTIILKTIDGGYNWKIQKILDSTLFVSKVFAFDSLHCYLLGPAGTTLFTINGGIDWDTSFIPGKNGDWFRSINFIDCKTIIAFSAYRWITVDGGYTWTREKDSTILSSPSMASFVNGQLGWMVSDVNPFATDAGFIANTTDGGKSWKYQDSLTAMMFGVDFADSLVGFAVGTNVKFSTGFIYSTRNGGKEWTYKQYLGSGPMFDVGFLNSNTGWVTGQSGRIWQTTDSGNSWTLYNTNSNTMLRDIIILRKEKKAYVLGGTSYTYNLLLYSDLSNISDVNENENNIPVKYYLSQNHPNPFNPTTLISYQLPISSHVTLKVYDMLGKEVAKLVDEEKIADDYKVTFNAGNLSSGVYFYRLTAGYFSQTKKMLFLK